MRKETREETRMKMAKMKKDKLMTDGAVDETEEVKAGAD